MKRKQISTNAEVPEKRARMMAAPEQPEDLAVWALSLPPVLQRFLHPLSLSESIRLRRVNRAFKDAIDIQLRTVKEMDMGKAGQRVDVLRLLEWMAEKAPAVQRIIFTQFGTGWTSTLEETEKVGGVMQKFQKLKALDLSQLSGPHQNEQTLTLLEAVAERLESVSFLFSVSFSTDRQRLDCIFQSFHRLQHLVFHLGFEGSLKIRLEKLPKPELLKQLVVTSLTWDSIALLPKFTALQDLKVARLYSFHNKNVAPDVMPQLQALKSLRFENSCDGYYILQALTRPVSMLPNLEELVANLDKHPNSPLPWHQLSGLKHLVLKGAVQQHLEGIHHLSSLTALELNLRQVARLSFALPQLQSLLVSGSSFITFQLQHCPNLTTVALCSCTSNFRAVIQGLFGPNPQIQHLILGWKFSPSKNYFQLMNSIFKNCPSLHTLELQGSVWMEDHKKGILSWKDKNKSGNFREVLALFPEWCVKLKRLKVLWDEKEHVEELLEIGKWFPQLSISSMRASDRLSSREPMFPTCNLSNFDVSSVSMLGKKR